MNIVVAPIVADKLDAFLKYAEELSGSRRADFEDYLHRYNLTRHAAFLQSGPTGPGAVIVVEGPGADALMPRFAVSEHPYDVEFRRRLEEIHGFSFSSPPPFAPPKMLADVRV